MNVLGNRIRKERENLNLSRENLAKKLGVSYSAIAMYEQGNREPNNEILLKMCEIFGCSIDYLIGNSEYRTTEEELNAFTKSQSINIIKQYIKNNESKFKNLKFDEKKINDFIHLATDDVYSSDDFTSNILNYLKTFENDQIGVIQNLLLGAFEQLMNNEEYLNSYYKLRALAEKEENGTVLNNSTSIFVYGTIPAGIPMECIEDIIDTEEISVDMLKGGKQYFGLKVKGNSMEPEYLNGDTIILQKVDDCENGDDCVVMVNGNDGTFKRVYKNKDGIKLQPLNPQYSSITYTNEQIENLPVRIIGTVEEIRRKKNKKR